MEVQGERSVPTHHGCRNAFVIYLLVYAGESPPVNNVRIMRMQVNERLVLMPALSRPLAFTMPAYTTHGRRPVSIPMLDDPHIHSDFLQKSRHPVIFAIGLEAWVMFVY